MKIKSKIKGFAAVSIIILTLTTSACSIPRIIFEKYTPSDNEALEEIKIYSDTEEKNNTEDTSETVSVEIPTQNGSSEKISAADIYQRNIESVVGITAEGVTKNIFGQTTKTASSGTGFVISSDGYILTNYHVVENSTEFSVVFADGTSYEAEIIGFENELSDLAVLKIGKSGLKSVTMSSGNMKVGEDITVIGNPLGELTFSLTKGVVSFLRREINTDGNPITMFQIDAAVNSGNSGGPAFDAYGNVVGIVTAKYNSEGIEGLGFCIPADDAAKYASDIISYGYVRGRASIGITGEDAYDIYSYYYRYYGNRVNQIKGLLSEGVYVSSVDSEGPASSVGLKKGDFITEINESAVSDCAALKSALKELSPNEEVSLTVSREGEIMTISLTLGEYFPKSGDSSSGVGI